jgi:hypothetical protein
MNSFRGNYDDLHVVATIAHRLSIRRAEEEGRKPSCRQHSLYHQAWIRAYTGEGHHYDKSEDECTCAEE